MSKKCLKREKEKMKEKRNKNRIEKTTKTRKKFKIWRNRIKVAAERKVVREKSVEQKKGKCRKKCQDYCVFFINASSRFSKSGKTLEF